MVFGSGKHPVHEPCDLGRVINGRTIQAAKLVLLSATMRVINISFYILLGLTNWSPSETANYAVCRVFTCWLGTWTAVFTRTSL
jgi:hypothetical protein